MNNKIEEDFIGEYFAVGQCRCFGRLEISDLCDMDAPSGHPYYAC